MISFVAHLLIRVMRLGDSVSGFCTFKYRLVVFLTCHSFLPQTLSNRKHWEICQSLLDSYHVKTLEFLKSVLYEPPREHVVIHP